MPSWTLVVESPGATAVLWDDNADFSSPLGNTPILNIDTQPDGVYYVQLTSEDGCVLTILV
ncbi:MAG: hypothetical protein R2795_23150 [Saprospiraceae bacterium]